jgi:hypothetical protein
MSHKDAAGASALSARFGRVAAGFRLLTGLQADRDEIAACVAGGRAGCQEQHANDPAQCGARGGILLLGHDPTPVPTFYLIGAARETDFAAGTGAINAN